MILCEKKKKLCKGFLYYHGKFELNWCDNVSSEIMQAIFFLNSAHSFYMPPPHSETSHTAEKHMDITDDDNDAV